MVPDTATLTIQEEGRQYSGSIAINPGGDPSSPGKAPSDLLGFIDFPIAPGMTVCGLDDQSLTIYAVTHGMLTADIQVPQNTHPLTLSVDGFPDVDLRAPAGCSVPSVQTTKLPAKVDLPGTTAQLSIGATGTVAELTNSAALDPTSPMVHIWGYTSTGDVVPPKDDTGLGGHCSSPSYFPGGWQLGPGQSQSVNLCFPTDGQIRYVVVALLTPVGQESPSSSTASSAPPPYAWVFGL
jgi:hypothetical protein